MKKSDSIPRISEIPMYKLGDLMEIARNDCDQGVLILKRQDDYIAIDSWNRSPLTFLFGLSLRKLWASRLLKIRGTIRDQEATHWAIVCVDKKFDPTVIELALRDQLSKKERIALAGTTSD